MPPKHHSTGRRRSSYSDIPARSLPLHPYVDESIRLPIKELRLGSRWRYRRGGKITWQSKSKTPISRTISWSVSPDERWMLVRYLAGDVHVEETVPLEFKYQPGIGKHWYFRCPLCRRRCSALYLVERWNCRCCHKLVYRVPRKGEVALHEQLAKSLSEYSGKEVDIRLVRRIMQPPVYELIHEEHRGDPLSAIPEEQPFDWSWYRRKPRSY